MSKKFTFKNIGLISNWATIIIFLALIRCISEPFRLKYYATAPISFDAIKPFLIGTLVTALALLVMTILHYFSRYKIIIAVSILTIVILFIIREVYLVP